VSRRCSVPEHIFIGEAEFPKDADDSRELFEEYAAWLARHDVPWSLQPTAEWHDWIQELATLPGKYAPPSGRLLLARCDHAATGCVGLRPIEPGICEMEAVVCAARVSRPELGIETRGASNREGKAISYSSMRLDTVPKAMPVADALYRNLGREIAGDRFPVSA
jgi:putative acetyltransferase